MNERAMQLHGSFLLQIRECYVIVTTENNKGVPTMKKILCLVLSLLFCISCFTACVSGKESTANPASTTALPTTSPVPDRGSLSVLFIGNSYTYYNNMPGMIFASIAEAAGYEPNVVAITNGGHSLYQHADPHDGCGLQVAKQLLPKNVYVYDFVVLQEQSMRPASDDLATFYDAVRDLANRAKGIEATPILYSTWGRRSDSPYLTESGLTNETMTWKLAASYTAIAEELDIPVGYVGLAFYEVYTGNSGIELYDPDTTHPSYAGSYLAAMTLFARMTGIDPTTVNFNGELSEQDAAVLKRAAKNAVFNTPEIPEEYRISSVGVTNIRED